MRENPRSESPTPELNRGAAPTIRLSIERLIVEGLPFVGREITVFQSALETELGRLLTEVGGSSFAASGGFSWADLPVTRLQLDPVQSPRAAGWGAARSILKSFQAGGLFLSNPAPSQGRAGSPLRPASRPSFGGVHQGSPGGAHGVTRPTFQSVNRPEV